MIAISIHTAYEDIIEFAAVNENNDLFHWFIGAGIRNLGWTFNNWLGYNHYSIVAVDFGSIKPPLLKVPFFPAWNRGVLDIESLYFNGVLIPRLEDIDSSVLFAGTRVKARAIMQAFLSKKNELLG